MIHCAEQQKAELVIVSRDSDFGVTIEDRSYVNDHLRQEFAERVSKKRALLLYTKLSEALKHFAVPISEQEEHEEEELIKAKSLAQDALSIEIRKLLEDLEDKESAFSKMRQDGTRPAMAPEHRSVPQRGNLSQPRASESGNAAERRPG